MVAPCDCGIISSKGRVWSGVRARPFLFVSLFLGHFKKGRLFGRGRGGLEGVKLGALSGAAKKGQVISLRKKGDLLGGFGFHFSGLWVVSGGAHWI
jgi:hypothetical protein